MPSLMHKLANRRTGLLTVGTLAAALAAGALPGTASASSSQIAIIQDGGATRTPATTIPLMRSLGASTIRVFLPWSAIAPDYSSSTKPAFNATDPNAYPSDGPTGGWKTYDAAVRQAAADHMTIDLTVTGGAPVWAEGPGIPAKLRNAIAYAWKPNAADFGQFVQAVGTRYSGHFTPAGASSPLPRVHFWAIYNEPNFGQDLGPQMLNNTRTPYAPMAFRNLLSAGWNALQRTGHGHDTILWGEFAAHGTNVTSPFNSRHQNLPGDYGQTKPLQFLRMVYCVDTNYKPLRGSDAKAIGCPTSSAATRRFRAANPALFKASGVSDHPYAATNQSPVQDGKSDPNYATFADLGQLGTALDSAAKAYGARPHFPIYNTEYGYITNPPHGGFPSPTPAAYYINWAEYLSYKNPRVKSYQQYEINDPPPATGPYAFFASGLVTYRGVHKATYDAYRLPFYMPTTSFSRRQSVEVWGAARPAPFAAIDHLKANKVQIQLKRGGKWTTVSQVATKAGGYFDVKLKFPASGTVRLAWTYPNDTLLPSSDNGATVYSRSFSIKVH